MLTNTNGKFLKDLFACFFYIILTIICSSLRQKCQTFIPKTKENNYAEKVTYDLSEEHMSDFESETKDEVSTPSINNNCKSKSYFSPTDLSSQSKPRYPKMLLQKKDIHSNNVLLLIVTMKL